MGSKILIDDCNWKPSKFTCKHLRGPNACMIRMVESKTSILSWKYGFDCNFCLSWLLCFSFSMDFLSVFFTILFFSFNEVLIPLHTHTHSYIYMVMVETNCPSVLFIDVIMFNAPLLLQIHFIKLWESDLGFLYQQYSHQCSMGTWSDWAVELGN